MKILIINGPNLNLVGTREPEVYGTESFEKAISEMKKVFTGIELEYFQSNHEGEIIDCLQKTNAQGIVLNAGGYTHTSVAIRDAVLAISTPVIEVHMSNVNMREHFRRTSLISDVCEGCITGFGMMSYKLAIGAFVEKN